MRRLTGLISAALGMAALVASASPAAALPLTLVATKQALLVYKRIPEG
jgi:hypothetical protein